ncbi:MAG TPA: citramalate synthase, partial [Clostridiales bacterium]|nr:citramalate synthase [Clostridiales bacterium]
MKKEKILIFDSTLRDGAQGEGISYSVSDKLSIVRALDDFGVDYIEAGNPGSNPKDIAFFREVRGDTLKHARLCAFGSTHKKGATPESDPNVLSLLRAETPAVSLFGKAWDLHVHKVLMTSLEENLDLVGNTVRYFHRQGREVIFDAEHFFDGLRDNPEYTLKVL